MAGPFGIHETARRLRTYEWVEGRLFELLGAWVVAVDEPEAKLLLNGHGHHHAWHAQLWRQLLPVLPPSAGGAAGGGAGATAEPVGDALQAFLSALADPSGVGQTPEKLVGVYRVLLPHTIADYSTHLERTSPVADGPIARALRLVLDDELEDWRAGEAVLQSLLTTAEEVERAAAHQARLESLLAGGGGIAGPGAAGLEDGD